MILENINGEAQTNINNVHTVKIEANATMFELLSSRLYSDKVMAVLRELSTNAVDAQIANGCKTSFKVHLPTRFEPYVSIRDFGIGMDNDTVIDLYGTMGASSKRNSNAYNGALGVGSKSPFAYTAGSAFTVTSFFNGEKTIYSVFADNGIPSIAELGRMPTDEPNGLEVNVPVQIHDIEKFKEAAIKLYRYFEFKPEVNLVLDLDLGTQTYSGTGWKLYSKQLQPVVVMANVAYPIDRSQLSALSTLQTMGLVIYADTGSVQFAASRESLSYTPNTVQKLTEINKLVTDEITAQVMVRIKQEKSLYNLSMSLRALPSSIKSIMQSQKINDYISNSRWSNFEIVNDDFIFRVPNSYNSKTSAYESISPDKLTGKTLVLADSAPAATAVTLNNTSKYVTLGFNKLLADFGGKLEAVKAIKDFANLIGIPYVLATEEHIKIFGAVVRTKGGKTTIATKLMYRASGFRYKPNVDYYSQVNNEIIVEATSKAMTIGIPSYHNNFMSSDYSTNIALSLSGIFDILKHIKYPKDLNIAVIPKSHKEHLANTIDIFSFIKALKLSELEYIPDSLRQKFNTPNWHIVGSLASFPKEFTEYTEYVNNLHKDPYGPKNEANVNRFISQLNKLDIAVKAVPHVVPDHIHKLHTRYEPLRYYSINKQNPDNVRHFATLVKLLGDHNVSNKSNSSN